MSARKRNTNSKLDAEEVDVSETPRTRSRTSMSKAKKSPSRKLVDEPEFVKQSSPSKDTHKSSPKKDIHYEFGGPIGAFGVILGTPFVMFMLFFLCNQHMCLSNPFLFDWSAFMEQIKFENFFSREACIMYLGWLAFNVALERILPGEMVEGTILPNSGGKRLKYTMSGHLQFWICLVAMGHAYPLISGTSSSAVDTDSAYNWLTEVYQFQGFMPLRLELIYDHYLQLISVSLVSTALFSLYL